MTAVAGPNVVDLICVLAPAALVVALGARGLLTVIRGKFLFVAIAMFVAATAISMLLSFLSFALLSVMDESLSQSGANASAGISLGTFTLPVLKFLARARFVRAVLVAFTQPSLLGVAGIACCLVLVYVRDALIRIGADSTVLIEHFAIFNTASAAAAANPVASK